MHYLRTLITSIPWRMVSIEITDEYISLSVRSDNSITRKPQARSLPNFMLVATCHGSIFLWWRCNTFCSLLPVMWIIGWRFYSMGQWTRIKHDALFYCLHRIRLTGRSYNSVSTTVLSCDLQQIKLHNSGLCDYSETEIVVRATILRRQAQLDICKEVWVVPLRHAVGVRGFVSPLKNFEIWDGCRWVLERFWCNNNRF